MSHPDDALDLYAPDGEPWCRFGAGLWCLNGERCLNPRHKPLGLDAMVAAFEAAHRAKVAARRRASDRSSDPDKEIP